MESIGDQAKKECGSNFTEDPKDPDDDHHDELPKVDFYDFWKDFNSDYE